ncbi:PEP-CTERM sorting domain-containing protein [Ideonella sp. BN130291]|uniref:PEP-CTERM sorting domain-containing protein n=1 Tax=Ideonella sp. BN130291 TaxID=3112940 RepID=UPI002E26A6A7|nr:PEP-CTERM sorting domain-containing protein [Ideonella sp. BN130291]
MNQRLFMVAAGLLAAQCATAALVTDPNDARNWQGATVGTFAQLYFGADTAANRQLVVDNKMLDDGIFDPAGYLPSTLIKSVGDFSWQGGGTSTDLTGTGGYAYTCCGAPDSRFAAANAIDNQWMQTGGAIGDTVWDLGFQANKAAVFNTIDHGPLPQEAIESTVYLSNDQVHWTQAVVERVWLEGFQANTGIVWDGFVYAVGTGTDETFRFASIVHGGPGALINDGDNEINGILGTRGDFTPPPVPEPTTWALLLAGLAGLGWRQRHRARP